jgi:hypothetical protein
VKNLHRGRQNRWFVRVSRKTLQKIDHDEKMIKKLTEVNIMVQNEIQILHKQNDDLRN